MDSRPTLTVRTRYLPHLLWCLPGYGFVLLFAGVAAHLYYHDPAITLRALGCIAFGFCIHAVLGYLQRPTLHFLGAKLYIRCRWGKEQELINLRARDFTLSQTAAGKRRNTGTLSVKDTFLSAYAEKGGIAFLHGVEDFDQVRAYVQKYFPA